jgi:hypothetical protein
VASSKLSFIIGHTTEMSLRIFPVALPVPVKITSKVFVSLIIHPR